MPIRKYNPTSPGRRFQTVQVFDEITTQEPFNSGILRANSINPSIKTETPEAAVQQQ